MNKSSRIRFILCLIGLLAAPVIFAADAAEADADAIQDQKPQTIVVEESAPHIPRFNTIATRLDIPLLWSPFHLGTVNEPVLRDQDARFLGEALRNISGLNPQTQSGVGDFFLIRGFDSVSSGLVLTDGAAEPELTFFPMYNVDRVEVMKGPGGFLYSRNGLSGASSGAVNIVRRQPLPGNFGRVNLSAGSYDTFQGSVDLNRTSEDDRFGFRLNAMAGASEFFRDDKDNETFAINPAFTWIAGDNTSINLNLEFVDSEYKPDSGIPLVGPFSGLPVTQDEIAPVPRTRSYQSPFDKSEQQVSRFQVDIETRLSDSWTLRNKTFYRNLDWESSGTLFNGVFANMMTSRPEVSRALTLLDDEQTFIGNQVEAVWSSDGDGIEQSLLTGFEVARYSDEFRLDLGCDPDIFAFSGGMQCLLPSIDLFDPVETASGLMILPFDAGDADTDVLAPYAIYQVRFQDRFQVLAGARVDNVDFEDKATGDSISDTDVSPMIGLVFQPVEDFNLYVNASESFAPPSSRVDEPTPEEGQQVEIGAKLKSFDGKLVTSAAIYELKRRNIPIVDVNGFTQQAGDQRSRGFELEIAAEPLPRFRALLSYAYTDAELTRFSERVVFGPGPMDFFVVDRSGKTPAFVPEHIVNLWLSKRFNSGLGVGAGGRYVSSQFIEEDNAFEIDDYVVLDAAVYYNFGAWDLSLNFKNITDEEYETRGFGATSVLPGNEFSVYGMVGYGF